jgi:polyketide biosynthesis acyl carrier protein
MDQQQVFELLVANTRQIIPGLEQHAFRFDDSLRELGANSIDRAEILMMTMDELSLTIPLVTFNRARNMGELATLLCQQEIADA